MDAGTPTPPPGSSEDGITELGYTLKGLARVLGRAPRTLENAKRGNELRLRGENAASASRDQRAASPAISSGGRPAMRGTMTAGTAAPHSSEMVKSG